MKKLKHLSEIYNSYDTFLIDLWGVMHNGVKLYPEAMTVIENLNKFKKKVVFLSNAPRPSANIIDFLQKLKIDKKYLQNVLTSGEAAFKSINENKFGKKFYHIGPPKDETLFSKIKENKSTLEYSDFILCTGLFNDKRNELKFYTDLLKNYKTKKFVCTNPDLTVHKGEVEEYCAGTVAKIFEDIGGKVTYYGKPHPEVYKICVKQNERTLVIGDNLRTDIKGANNFNLDSVFITDGIHKSELNDEENLIFLLNKYNVKINFFQKKLNW